MNQFDPRQTKTELLEYIDTFDPILYAKTRNHLGGQVSKLSPYITRGVISLPDIRDRILSRYAYQDAEKFIQELAWREYWQKVWFAKRNNIFSDVRFSRDDWRHVDLVSAIVEASTGVAVVDEAIRGLYDTGYMHNHARMWVAMISGNIAKAHWYEMSKWMYYHLIDGDLASNTLSWQWIVGTNAGKRYVANQALINACSASTQTGTYLDVERDEVGLGAIPKELRPAQPFTYTTSYPESDECSEYTDQRIFLYSPWTLDPDWHAAEAGARLLVIEPKWFDRFPVSKRVMDFIVEVAKTQIPNIKVIVKNIEELPLNKAATTYVKRYPATLDWPGEHDQSAQLFPQVQGYYPSFFKFWQRCR